MNPADPSPKKRHEAVERILSILNAFTDGNPRLSLTDIAERTGLYKSTVHRNVQSLLQFSYLVRGGDGQFRLGPAAMRLGRTYQRTFDSGDCLPTVLRHLAADTQETASFFIREGNRRLCLYRYNSPRPVSHTIHEGAFLPLDRGVTGRVFLAFSGAEGDLYNDIRRKGYEAAIGERIPECFSINTPVFDRDRELVGVLAVPIPRSRYSDNYAQELLQAALVAATEISRGLGFQPVASQH
jgi:DNA-binding IclR family transcriptional regulator